LLIIASYLVNFKQSKALRELRLDHCFLTGKDIAYLLQSMTETPGKARELHLDVSENYIEQDLKKLTRAIAAGYAPSSLAIRLIEFEEEAEFRRMVLALAENNTIRQLDISRASLPCDASEETCQAMEKMFADNTSLEWLDMSGEDSRLETTKLGVGINRALRGLQHNRTLRVLYIKCKYLLPVFPHVTNMQQTRSLGYKALVLFPMSSRSTRAYSISTVRIMASP
jgi:hypothetical protein